MALEPYQEALIRHVAAIPEHPETLNSGAPNDKTKGNAVFTDYTGLSHAGLLADWANGKMTTSCNSFITMCGVAMGYKGSVELSRFEVADMLTTVGLSHCWIKPDSGAEPECGDIFRLLGDVPDHNGVRKNHMGVVLGVENGNWRTVEGGQGGKIAGCDKLCKKWYFGAPGDLRGWVSMKAMLNAGKPLPTWLGGWWKVDQEPYDTWYYYFGNNGRVGCTGFPPPSPIVPPHPAQLTGTFEVLKGTEVRIKWASDDYDETLTIITDPDYKARKDKLIGKTNRGEKLKGVRLLQTERVA